MAFWQLISDDAFHAFSVGNCEHKAFEALSLSWDRGRYCHNINLTLVKEAILGLRAGKKTKTWNLHKYSNACTCKHLHIKIPNRGVGYSIKWTHYSGGCARSSPLYVCVFQTRRHSVHSGHINLPTQLLRFVPFQLRPIRPRMKGRLPGRAAVLGTRRPQSPFVIGMPTQIAGEKQGLREQRKGNDGWREWKYERQKRDKRLQDRSRVEVEEVTQQGIRVRMNN